MISRCEEVQRVGHRATGTPWPANATSAREGATTVRTSRCRCGVALAEEVPLTKSGDGKKRADRRFGRDHLVTTRASSICTEGGGWKWLVGPARRWRGSEGAA